MTRAGLKGRCYLELKSVLLEVGYIEKWPKFAYLKSKVPHLKIRVKRNQVYVHYRSCVPGERGRMGPTRAVSHCHLQHHGVFLYWGLINPFQTSASASDSPCTENRGAPSSCMYSLCLGNTSLLSPHTCQGPSQAQKKL